tara:strand:- start:1562 stop:2425 length:864 start_codon:yes stop_codon:yes gene_type:complete
MFFDENMMYDLRLNLLNDYVDKFVVVESLYTHRGNKKKQNFNIEDYKKFKDKIIYILIDEEPNDLYEINDEKDNEGLKRLNTLKRIKLQYNSLEKGIKDADLDDLIILSDCDEIPNLKNIKENINNDIVVFKQRLYYFKFNYLYKNYDWFGSKACKKKLLKTFEWLRYVKSKRYGFWRIDTMFSDTKYKNIKIIEDGGWHFTKIKKPEDIFYTLSNFGEYNEFVLSGLTADDFRNFITKGELPYDHAADKKSSVKEKFSNIIKLEKNSDHLPEFLIKNKEKYKNWFS